MEQRKEVIFSDLGNLCQPRENISALRTRDAWNTISYETPDIRGTLLAAQERACPADVYLAPKLTGWYRIFVAMPCVHSSGNRSRLDLLLSGEKIVSHFSHQGHPSLLRQQIQEVFWKCADMTGQDVIIRKNADSVVADALLAWLRFVPMDEAEVSAFQLDQLRTDTKRLYVTNDMHAMICAYSFKTREQWRSIIDDYDQSDAEWFSFENMWIYDGEASTENLEQSAFARPVDRRFQELHRDSYTKPMLKDVIDYGHSRGLKICSSLRMGGWGMGFPYDHCYFDNKFYLSHQHLRCMDRDGDPISALSYLYPEVQDYIIGHLLEMAKLGVDAVELMSTRGIPYLLFEQPFVDAYREEFGEDPRFLPLDDPQLMAFRCQLMMKFFRRVRKALDEACGKGKVRIHLRSLFSLYDSRYIGIDLEQLAKEKLIDTIICFPQQVRELLQGDVWQADGKHIDLEKYHTYMTTGPEPQVSRKANVPFLPPLPDSRGVLQGPATQQERVQEVMALEQKYGVTVYFDLMPRITTPQEVLELAKEMYRCGAERFSMWDTYNRVPSRLYWSVARHLGHKEELDAWDCEDGTRYRLHRVLKYGDMDFSRYMPTWGG